VLSECNLLNPRKSEPDELRFREFASRNRGRFATSGRRSVSSRSPKRVFQKSGNLRFAHASAKADAYKMLTK